MYLKKVVVYILSTKQKIKGNISIEDDLVGVDNIMSKILCSIYFIESQGYKIVHNKLMQDNKSDILLEHNGKLYRYKWTKHINNSFFW